MLAPAKRLATTPYVKNAVDPVEAKLAQYIQESKPGQAIARTFHASPLMTLDEKIHQTNLNRGKSFAAGVPAETAQIGGQLAKGVPLKTQRQLWGEFHDAGLSARSPEDAAGALTAVRGDAEAAGALPLFDHWLNSMQEVKGVDVGQGFLQKVRSGDTYLPGVLQKQSALDKLKARWSGESINPLETPEATPSSGEIIPGNVRQNPFNQPRLETEFANLPDSISANPAAAIATREKVTYSNAAQNEVTKQLVNSGGKLESDAIREQIGRDHPEIAPTIMTTPLADLQKTDLYKEAAPVVRQQLASEGRQAVPFTIPTPLTEKGAQETGAVAGPAGKDSVWVDKSTVGKYISNPHTIDGKPVDYTGLNAPTYPTSLTGKAVRGLTNEWRNLETNWKPKYLVERTVSDPVRAYEAGMFPSLKDAVNAWKTYKGRLPSEMETATGKMTGEAAANAARSYDVAKGGMLYGEGRQFKNPWTRLIGGTVQKQQALMRTAEYYKALRAGGSPELANQAMNKFAFNMQDLSPAESRFGKTLAPFYGWVRKNVPFQYSTLARRPGKLAPFAAATASLNRVHLNALEAALTPSFTGAGGYMATGSGPGGINMVQSKDPITAGLNFLSEIVNDPTDMNSMGNPFATLLANQISGQTSTGETLKTGTTPVAGEIGHLMSLIPGLRGLVTKGPDGNWLMNRRAFQYLQLIGPVQSANQTLKSGPGQLGRIISQVAPVNIQNMNMQQQYQYALQDLEAKAKPLTQGQGLPSDTDLSGLGMHKNVPEKLPTSPAMLKKLAKLNPGVPVTTIEAALQARSQAPGSSFMYSPAHAWPTATDVTNASKRGYAYSYNQAAMTPAEKVAAAALASSKTSGGTGYGRHYGGGHYYTRSTKGKAPKVVKLAKAKKMAVSSPTQFKVKALPSSVQAKMPHPVTLKGASSMDQLKASLRGKGLPAIKASTPTAGKMPAHLSAAFRQIAANHFAVGGSTPSNLAELTNMLAQQGLLTPEIIQMLQQEYGSSLGANNG